MLSGKALLRLAASAILYLLKRYQNGKANKASFPSKPKDYEGVGEESTARTQHSEKFVNLDDTTSRRLHRRVR